MDKRKCHERDIKRTNKKSRDFHHGSMCLKNASSALDTIRWIWRSEYPNSSPKQAYVTSSNSRRFNILRATSECTYSSISVSIIVLDKLSILLLFGVLIVLAFRLSYFDTLCNLGCLFRHYRILLLSYLFRRRSNLARLQ